MFVDQIVVRSMEGNIDPKNSSWWEYTSLNNGSFNLVMPPMFPSYANAMLGSEEQRNFMVFDHSRDQTSLIYSSVAGTQHPSFHANVVTNVENGHESEEMHENTEEIDALLYSESNHIENHDDDDEVMSTGHSPEDLNFDCSSTPTKKRRLDINREFYDTSLLDTASSTSSREGLEANKKLKRKRIQETVSMLRRIIPGGKGKDTAAVLDEAINYLRSLKLRFKKPLFEGVDIMHQ